MSQIRFAFGVGAALVLSSSAALAQWAPERSVEFNVAAGAGGGSDIFARTIQAVIGQEGLMDESIVVLNKGGGSGAEAFIYAKANAEDPHKLFFGTNNVYLLPLVTPLGYTAEDLTPVAALAVDEFILWVNGESEYGDVNALLEAARAAPGEIVIGGSQSRDVDETLVALIEQTADVDFRYLPFNGGGETATQLAGGHIAANVNNPSENLGQWQAGGVKPLCVFSTERMAGTEEIAGGMSWSDIPTCTEAGLAIDRYQLPRTVWLPAGVPQEVVDYYAGVLRQVSETPEWAQYLQSSSQTGQFLTGDELSAFIAESEGNARRVFEAEGWLVN